MCLYVSMHMRTIEILLFFYGMATEFIAQLELHISRFFKRPLWQETSSENMRSELRVTMWVNWRVCEGF